MKKSRNADRRINFQTVDRTSVVLGAWSLCLSMWELSDDQPGEKGPGRYGWIENLVGPGNFWLLLAIASFLMIAWGFIGACLNQGKEQ